MVLTPTPANQAPTVLARNWVKLFERMPFGGLGAPQPVPHTPNIHRLQTEIAMNWAPSPATPRR
jgi:hypothetical protein